MQKIIKNINYLTFYGKEKTKIISFSVKSNSTKTLKGFQTHIPERVSNPYP
jgi:hypothetical protein